MIFHKFPGKFRESRGIVGVVERKIVELTAAQVKALFTTPIVLVEAPGAGMVVQVISAVAKLDAGATPFAGANALELRYTGASGAKVTGDVAAALINSATDRADVVVGVAVTAVPNAPVVAAVPTANPTAGDGTIRMDILYRVIKMTE